MMSYLFVIPLYAFALAVALIAAFVCRFIPEARRFGLYFFAGALGSVAGMIVANLTLFLVLAPFVKGTTSSPSAPDRLHLWAAFFVQVGAIIGPFFVSAVGTVLGAAVACTFVRNAQRRAATGAPDESHHEKGEEQP